MTSVQAGLRAGDLQKDTYGRLECAACDTQLGQRNPDSEIGVIRTCPDCGREWEDFG